MIWVNAPILQIDPVVCRKSIAPPLYANPTTLHSDSRAFRGIVYYQGTGSVTVTSPWASTVQNVPAAPTQPQLGVPLHAAGTALQE
jgi:hypothetical protein